MERSRKNYLRDLIHRLRANESQRQTARDLRISHTTVRHYHEVAQQHGLLAPDSPMPDDATLAAVWRRPEPRKPDEPLCPICSGQTHLPTTNQKAKLRAYPKSPAARKLIQAQAK